jgi:hypothetical protein
LYEKLQGMYNSISLRVRASANDRSILQGKGQNCRRQVSPLHRQTLRRTLMPVNRLFHWALGLHWSRRLDFKS